MINSIRHECKNFTVRFIAVISFFLLIIPAFGGEDVGLRVMKLNRILADLHAIKHNAHYLDESRIFALEETVLRLRHALESEAVGSADITFWQMMFFSKLKVSQPFFRFIGSAIRSRASISELVNTYEEIRKATRYDELPASREFYGYFTQLSDLISRLRENENVSADLQIKLNRVYGLLMEAKGLDWTRGDSNARTMFYVRQVNEKIKGMREDLSKLDQNRILEDLSREIIGNNDILSSHLEMGK